MDQIATSINSQTPSVFSILSGNPSKGLQFAPCPLCGKSKERLIAIQNFYRMVECHDCGFIYVNPRPDWNTLNRLYQSYQSRDAKDAESWAALMKNIFKETACFIRKQYSQPGRLLDIGCGYGHFLNLMRGCGWNVRGLEPSSTSASYARQQGLRVVHGTLDDVKYEADLFDVITMFYVLEHLLDPVGTLLKINNILKPGGILILRVPHTTPIVKLLSILRIENNLYDLPFHLGDFSPITIRSMLKRTGYEAIHTFPGKPTSPENYLERFAAALTGKTANILYKLSMKKFLLPGISKTTIGKKSIRP